MRRLRLWDLPPVARWLARATLALTLLAAALLAAQTVIETGDGPFQATTYGGTTTQISIVGMTLVFGGCAVGMELAAYAAPARWRRVVAAGVALGGLSLLPVDYGSPLASWLVFSALTAIVLLLSAAIFGLPRSRHTLAALAVFSPLAALACIVLTAGIKMPPPDIQVANRVTTDNALGGVALLTGVFVALSLWGVIEGSRALSAAAAAVLPLKPRCWFLVPAAAGLKLAWLAATSAGMLSFIAPPTIDPRGRRPGVVAQPGTGSRIHRADRASRSPSLAATGECRDRDGRILDPGRSAGGGLRAAHHDADGRERCPPLRHSHPPAGRSGAG